MINLLLQNSSIGAPYFTQASCAEAQNSAFGLDQATTLCFLLLHVTQVCTPKNTIRKHVLLSIIEPCMIFLFPLESDPTKHN